MIDRPGEVLRNGLSGLAERQKLIANNLANVDTPGYRSLDVSFERILERQVKGSTDLALVTTSPAHMAAPPPGENFSAQGLAKATRAGDVGVDVDAEMARLSETVIEYNAVAQLMAARLSLLRSAVTEGRR